MGTESAQSGTVHVSAEPVAPSLPQPRLYVGVTGHRASHPSFPLDPGPLQGAIAEILSHIDEALSRMTLPTGAPCTCQATMVTLLADGADHIAANTALERNWGLLTPLPFGRNLNAAINAQPVDAADASAIIAGKAPVDPTTAGRVKAIEDLAKQACLFELADQDALISSLYLRTFVAPGDRLAVDRFQLATARRASLAGGLLVEQADILIAVWDGVSTVSVGGTGHTVSAALQAGCPVVWIDPANPAQWQVFHSPEDLAARSETKSIEQIAADLRACVETAIGLEEPKSEGLFSGLDALAQACWRNSSNWSSHAYRRVETLFGTDSWSERLGSLSQTYERPDDIARGSGAPLLEALKALPGGDAGLAQRMETEVFERFAWANGIATYLADRYRSGMVLNFVLGAAAIVVGILYLPLVDVEQKWIFAGLELALLIAIIANTSYGLRHRLHGRWFETRRAAEYLRHGPFMLALGVARSPARWPHGVRSWWPEWYARHSLRAVGLPHIRVDARYLRSVLEVLQSQHVGPQSGYHHAKSTRLHKVHHRLDKMSELSFAAAVGVVLTYLVFFALSATSAIDLPWLPKAAKWFTVAAVALPTIGGAIAAIRYFCDFDRFAGISQVAAQQLDEVNKRIDVLLSAPDERLDFPSVARLAHDADDIVFSEIQAWQAVFGAKRTTIPA